MDYIPDKQLYAAVMFAKKMMREGKAPGLAISISAKYYDRTPSEINSAMHSGAKRKKTSSPFYWWVIGTVTQTCEASQSHISNIEVKKATCAANASNRHFNCRDESYWDIDKFCVTLNKVGFKTKTEAEKWARSSECEKAKAKYVWGE